MFFIELDDGVEDPKSGVHGAFRIVLTGDRRAEDGHDCVADELLDRTAKALDLLLHARVIRTQSSAYILGIRLLRRSGESDEVDEEDGDDLALFRCRPRRFGECGAASPAESRSLGVLLAAAGTGHHSQSLRRHGHGAKRCGFPS